MELQCKFWAKSVIYFALFIILISSVAAKLYTRQQILRALDRHSIRRDYDYIDSDSSIEEELRSSRLRDRYPEFFDRKDDYSSSSGKKAMKRVDSSYGVSRGVSAGGKLLLVLLPFMMIPFILLPLKLFVIFKMLVAGKMVAIAALLAKVLSKPKFFKKLKKFKKGKKCKGAFLALLPLLLIGLLLSSILSGIISGVVSGIISGIIALVNATITNSTTTTTQGKSPAKSVEPVELYVIPEMSVGYQNNRYSYKLDRYVEQDNRTRTDACLLSTEDFRDMNKNEIRILMNLLERKYSKEPWVTCSVKE